MFGEKAFCLGVETSLRVRPFMTRSYEDEFRLQVYFHEHQTHFHLKGFAQGLALNQAKAVA